MKRTRVSLAVVALAAGFSLSACGGAPTDAPKADFCDAMNSLFEDMDLTEMPSDEEMAKAYNEWGDRLEEVGTPEDISDDAREGFEIMVDEIKDVDANDFEEGEIKEGADDLSKDDEKKTDAFFEYATETCDDEGESDGESPDGPVATDGTTEE